MAAPKLQELRAMPTDELIRRHDDLANSTSVGLAYYLNEIARRDQEKHTKTILTYTLWIVGMTFIMTISTLANIAIAIFRCG